MKTKKITSLLFASLTTLSLVLPACNSHPSKPKKAEQIKATRVYVANLACDLFAGYSYTVNPVLYPYNATNNIKYDIEDPNILYVYDEKIYGAGVGTSLVYVYNDEDKDNVRDEDEAFTVMAFSVTNPNPSISINVDREVTIAVGESKKLNYSVTGDSGGGLDYGFYSEDEDICSISSGFVKGHKAGTAKVSVSWQGYRGYCKVNVIDLVDEQGLRASEITSEKNIVLQKGKTKSLSYSILPKKSIDKLTSVTSNNESVIKVNDNKSITAVGGGSAVVTLTTTNGKYTRVLVTVKDDAQQTSSYYNNYYGDLTWENGEDLKSKLHDIISQNVTPLRYNAPNWETNQMADQDLYDYAFVDGVYDDNPILKTNTNAGWQREHAFAASLMTGFSTGDAVESLGRSTDFHNLFASNAGANGSRGNKNYGYVKADSQELSEKENCLYTRKAWEPADEDKGKLARAIFYMDTMYNKVETVDVTETWTYRGDDTSSHTGASKTVHVNTNEQALSIVEDNVDYTRISINDFMMPNKEATSKLVEYYRSLIRKEDSTSETTDFDNFRKLAYERYLNTSMPYAIGHRSDLLMWNSYAVDLLEMQHNQSVYSYNSTQGRGTQGNRNPFVDYPQLVDYIYGDLKDQPGSISMLTPTYLALDMDKDEIHHYAVDSSTLEAFQSGTKPTAEDFHIKAIKNDLTEGVLDISKIQVEDYTFTDDDVETGKVITITTDKNTLKVPVKVTSDAVVTFDTCIWNHIDNNTSGHNKECYGSYNNGVFENASFSNLAFTVTFGNAFSLTSTNFQNSGANGTKIGTGSVSVGTLTFATKSAFNVSGKTKVNNVFFIASTASGKSYGYSISVGETVIGSGTFTGQNIEIKATTLEELTGVVEIKFTNVTAAINIRGLAINAVE